MPDAPEALVPAIERVVREEYGPAVSVLVRAFRDITARHRAIDRLRREASRAGA